MKNKEIVYFQPEGIKPKYCEAGVIMENDLDHIWFLDEPCKILKSEVKIIPKEFVHFDKKTKCYLVIKDPHKESVAYKMSAVEWLEVELKNWLEDAVFLPDEIFRKAKEMHKEQTIDACNHGVNYEDSPYINAENYYNETYGTGNI